MVLEGHKSLSMQDHFVEVPTATGRMETFVTHPQQDGPFPPVILYMDIWGVREELYNLARRVWTVGYYVMVPDFYYRQGRIRTDFRDSHGKAISLDRLDKEAQQRALAPQKKLSDAMVVEDTGAILNFLSQDTNADRVRLAQLAIAWAAATRCRRQRATLSDSRPRPAYMGRA